MRCTSVLDDFVRPVDGRARGLVANSDMTVYAAFAATQLLSKVQRGQCVPSTVHFGYTVERLTDM